MLLSKLGVEVVLVPVHHHYHHSPYPIFTENFQVNNFELFNYILPINCTTPRQQHKSHSNSLAAIEENFPIRLVQMYKSFGFLRGRFIASLLFSFSFQFLTSQYQSIGFYIGFRAFAASGRLFYFIDVSFFNFDLTHSAWKTCCKLDSFLRLPS